LVWSRCVLQVAWHRLLLSNGFDPAPAWSGVLGSKPVMTYI
jgi:hypothetical protein